MGRHPISQSPRTAMGFPSKSDSGSWALVSRLDYRRESPRTRKRLVWPRNTEVSRLSGGGSGTGFRSDPAGEYVPSNSNRCDSKFPPPFRVWRRTSPCVKVEHVKRRTSFDGRAHHDGGSHCPLTLSRHSPGSGLLGSFPLVSTERRGLPCSAYMALQVFRSFLLAKTWTGRLIRCA